MNRLKQMVEEKGDSSLKVYDELFRNGDIVAQGTFYRAISGDEIPTATEFGTVVKIAETLGYRIEFVRSTDGNIM